MTPTNNIILHQGDLPSLQDKSMKSLVTAKALAVDTEARGLNIKTRRICLVQISAGDGICHLVQILPKTINEVKPAPNLRTLLSNQYQLKIFHYARFDMAALQYWLGAEIYNVYCTKIASKLVRTYGARHSLGSLTKELLNIELDKEAQSSDWAKPVLSKEQQHYAAQDVLYLHQLKDALDEMLIRESYEELAEDCFDFLPTRVLLDLFDFDDMDIFAHS